MSCLAAVVAPAAVSMWLTAWRHSELPVESYCPSSRPVPSQLCPPLISGMLMFDDDKVELIFSMVEILYSSFNWHVKWPVTVWSDATNSTHCHPLQNAYNADAICCISYLVYSVYWITLIDASPCLSRNWCQYCIVGVTLFAHCVYTLLNYDVIFLISLTTVVHERIKKCIILSTFDRLMPSQDVRPCSIRQA